MLTLAEAGEYPEFVGVLATATIPVKNCQRSAVARADSGKRVAAPGSWHSRTASRFE